MAAAVLEATRAERSDAERRRADAALARHLPPARIRPAAAIGNRGLARLAARARSSDVRVRRSTALRDVPARPTLSRCACTARSDQEGAALDEGAVALSRAVAARRALESGADGSRTLARDTPATVTVDVAPGGCSLAQHHAIEPAVTTSMGWLRRSIAQLDAFIAGPSAATAATKATAKAMDRHFKSATPDAATYVRNRLARILNDVVISRTLTTECHTNADDVCTIADAYQRGGSLLVFCPTFFTSAENERAGTVIHEMAHTLVNEPPIKDRAHSQIRHYRWMSRDEALTNAASYELLARELGTGTAAADTAPRDTIEDCPEGWREPLARAIALAEHWNDIARGMLHDARPEMRKHWENLQTTYLGATDAAALNRATQVYDAAGKAFGSKIDFECEADATGGRCAKHDTYWYGLWSDFHICPSWRALPTETERAEALLRGFYGYKDIEENAQRREKLAALARELTNKYLPTPAPIALPELMVP